ncbi:DUF7507 domain-containing protein, partial [Algoriphagus yeomjeoni]
MDHMSNDHPIDENISSNNFLGEKSHLRKNLFLLFAIFLISSFSFGQVVPVTTPAGGFEIDGNLISNSPTNGAGDWVQGGSGSGGFLFNANGTPVNVVRTVRFQDPYSPSTDNVFQGGGKFNDNPNNTWKWQLNSTSGKSDIGNVFVHLAEDATNDQWIIVGADRLETNGTSYIDFEFLQGTIAATGTSGNNRPFTASGPHNGRTIGDFLISVEYTNGGSNPIVRFYRWSLISGTNYDYIEQFPGPIAFAATNSSGSVSAPLGAFGTNTYSQFQFVEAAINVSAFFTGIGNPCDGLTIGTVFVKTKSSSSTTASLEDFVAPVPVKLVLGNAEISYSPADLCNSFADVTLDGVLGGVFSSTQGLSIDSQTGRIDLTNSTPGTYTVTYSFLSEGCPKTTTTSVTIPNKAPAPAVASFDYCIGDGNKTPVVTPAQGYTIKWYDSAMNPLAAAPSISTTTAGTFTYYISQIKSGECESTKALVTIKVDSCSLTLVKAATNGPSGEDCLDPTLNPTINYSFLLTNNGAFPLSNIQLSDPLFQAPNPAVSFTLSNNGNGDAILDVNESWTYTASYTITPTDIENGQVENQATASGVANGKTVSDLSGTAVDNDTPTIVPICQEEEFSITKLATPQTYDAVGDEISYDITVTNDGNVTLEGILVTDPLTGLSQLITSLAPQADTVIVTTYTIDQDDLDAGQVDNTATATFGQEERTADEQVTAIQEEEFSITKL